MKCQKCGNYDATTHITEVVNGLKSESYLCAKCAGVEGGKLDFGSVFSSDLDSFFSSLWSSPKALSAQICPNCKSTLADLQKRGRLGCSECYKTFYDFLLRPLKEIHGSTRHTGKIPSRAGKITHKQNEVSRLRSELDRAVLDQNFEKAAELRDRIKEIEQNNEEV